MLDPFGFNPPSSIPGPMLTQGTSQCPPPIAVCPGMWCDMELVLQDRDAKCPHAMFEAGNGATSQEPFPVALLLLRAP